jgi:hypothetical protein
MDWIHGFIDHLYTPLGTTLYRSPTNTDWCPRSMTVSTSRLLATASTEGDSSASHAQVLLSQPPVQNSCQLSTDISTSWVPGWRSFHTDLVVFSSHADFQLNSLTHQPATSLSGTADSSHQQLLRRESYFTNGGLPPISSSWRQAPRGSRPDFFN